MKKIIFSIIFLITTFNIILADCEEYNDQMTCEYAGCNWVEADYYYGSYEWCEGEEIRNCPDKKSVRNSLKKWQEKSRYGLNYGKKKSEAGSNGYEKSMKFNLVINQ